MTIVILENCEHINVLWNFWNIVIISGGTSVFVIKFNKRDCEMKRAKVFNLSETFWIGNNWVYLKILCNWVQCKYIKVYVYRYKTLLVLRKINLYSLLITVHASRSQNNFNNISLCVISSFQEGQARYQESLSVSILNVNFDAIERVGGNNRI